MKAKQTLSITVFIRFGINAVRGKSFNFTKYSIIKEIKVKSLKVVGVSGGTRFGWYLYIASFILLSSRNV